jgi:hypothetical protein
MYCTRYSSTGRAVAAADFPAEGGLQKASFPNKKLLRYSTESLLQVDSANRLSAERTLGRANWVRSLASPYPSQCVPLRSLWGLSLRRRSRLSANRGSTMPRCVLSRACACAPMVRSASIDPWALPLFPVVQFDLVVSALSEFANTAILIDQNLNEIAVGAWHGVRLTLRPRSCALGGGAALRQHHLQ